ncbi:MAG: lipocalin-like domain-containing protein, partial [Candidatus Thermoplasmatota archaeon]
MLSNIRKIDAVIVVALIIIAAVVLFRADYFPDETEIKTPDIGLKKDEQNKVLIVRYISGKDVNWRDIRIEGDCKKSHLIDNVEPNDVIRDCQGKITLIYIPTDEIIGSWSFKEVKPPGSITLPNKRVVSPADEGKHYDKLFVNREWWYWSAVFGEESELSGWSISISFMRLARGDLLATFKPDVMVFTLHGPNGEEYGGLINKKRGIDLFGGSTLEAKSSGVEIEYGDSWAQGRAPTWYVYAEDEDIDKNTDLVADLKFTSQSDPLWLHSNGLLDKGDAKIADYIFPSLKVTGTVKIDGKSYNVEGTGHHEHSWSNGLLKTAVKGWDWSYIQLNNGWNIYYNKYYLSSQFNSDDTSKINPVANVILTTDKGETLTLLKDISITKETEQMFNKVKKPTEIKIKAKPSNSQLALIESGIQIDLTIHLNNVYEKIFNSLPKVGMDIGRASVEAT